MLKVALFCAKSLLQKNITCIFNLLFGHPLKFLGIWKSEEFVNYRQSTDDETEAWENVELELKEF